MDAHRGLMILITLLSLSTNGYGQTTAELLPGTPVRVWSKSYTIGKPIESSWASEFRGIVVKAASDTLLIRSPGWGDVAISFGAIERLQTSTHSRRSKRPILYGFLAGAGLGAVGGIQLANGAPFDDYENYDRPASERVFFIAIGVAGGALVGSLVGLVISATRSPDIEVWEEATPPGIGIGIRPRPKGGMALSLDVRF